MSELEREDPNQTDDDRGTRAGGDAETKGTAVENCGNEYRELPGDVGASVGNSDVILAGDSTKVGKP
jgi:hypothetical protein